MNIAAALYKFIRILINKKSNEKKFITRRKTRRRKKKKYYQCLIDRTWVRVRSRKKENVILHATNDFFSRAIDQQGVIFWATFDKGVTPTVVAVW